MPSDLSRRAVLTALCLAALPRTGRAEGARPAPRKIIETWYQLAFDLVRHTPTYTPPVASRAFGYIGVALYEAARRTEPGLVSLAGQLNGLTEGPQTEGPLDAGLVLHGALAEVVAALFPNTGPTGQRALTAVTEKLGSAIGQGLDPDLSATSGALGKAVGQHIVAWAATDGGGEVGNLGFTPGYKAQPIPADWVPTNKIALQQTPLLPNWGQNRPFALPDGAACGLPPPTEYSEDPSSAFYREAMEVYDTVRNLTDEQADIARFWADDAMLSRTPPGHWIAIALAELDREGGDLARHADVLARLGIAVADAFISCWHDKYVYRLLRPVTYIRRLIDPKWEPLLNTPPFPEYPSGHSTVSGAAAAVLTALYGDDHAFADETPANDGLASRSFASFNAAADEAGLSRLYGGIHFRPAIERGLQQGRCIAEHAIALRTRA